MKRILFAAHDPGGMNVLAPVIDFFAQQEEYEVLLVLLGPAKGKYRIPAGRTRLLDIPSAPLPDFPNELGVAQKDVAKLLQAHAPDCIFTATSYNSTLEKHLIALGRQLRIPTAAILDFWGNYRLRFTVGQDTHFPDLIFVADQKMATGLKQEGVGADIVLCGNPHLSQLAATHARPSAAPASTKKIFRFFSENIAHYFPDKPLNEFTIVAHILRFLEQATIESTFIVRPHPMESPAPWQALINEQPANAIDLCLDTLDFNSLLSQPFTAIGLTSMALIETAVCGIPTFSYQIAVPDDGYLFLPYEEYDIIRLQEEKDLEMLLATDSIFTRKLADKKRGEPLQIIQQHITNLLAAQTRAY